MSSPRNSSKKRQTGTQPRENPSSRDVYGGLVSMCELRDDSIYHHHLVIGRGKKEDCGLHTTYKGQRQ